MDKTKSFQVMSHNGQTNVVLRGGYSFAVYCPVY